MRESTAAQIMEIVGTEAMREICRRYGGTRVYIPHIVPGQRELIVSQFDEVLPNAASVMSAYETVAEQNGVTVRTVQRLVNQN